MKTQPYNSAKFHNEQPIDGYDYKAPDGTLWNVDTVEGNTVRLWTINAWNQTHWQSVNLYEFERTWTERTPTLTARLSWRTKQDQFFQSAGCGQIHRIRFMGTCVECGRSVYSHGCTAAKSCGDRLQDSPDPRGIIPAAHCMNLYHAREYDLTGPDVMTCAACADDGEKYNRIIAAAKASKTWTKPAEQNNCDGSGPHSLGEVRVMPTGGDGNLILCMRCWMRENTYRIERNKDLDKSAQFEVIEWQNAKVYEVQ